MQIEKTVSMKPHELKMLISSIKYSLTAVREKLKKNYSGVKMRSDMDEREQENYDTLINTRVTYTRMLETLKELEGMS